LIVDERLVGSGSRGIGGIGGVGARQGIVASEKMNYREGRKGGFDSHARIPDMDFDGIDASFLYPSLGLFVGGVRDPELARAICRAYNRWLADYCRPYPDRLFGVAMLPMQSVEHAIEEMTFARNQLGSRAGLFRPNPYGDRLIHDQSYEPFWSAADDLDFSIGFHEGGMPGMPQIGVDRFATRGPKHIVSHTLEMMLACLSMIWGGVCERHPKLRVGFLEAGGGWVAVRLPSMTGGSTCANKSPCDWC
jgi:predicted TIM-barrel fold metal-dependent hydrolase